MVVKECDGLENPIGNICIFAKIVNALIDVYLTFLHFFKSCALLNVLATVYSSVHGCQKLSMAQFQNMFLKYNLEIKLVYTISGTSVIETSVNVINCSVTERKPCVSSSVLTVL